jgi:hypothetical protein
MTKALKVTLTSALKPASCCGRQQQKSIRPGLACTGARDGILIASERRVDPASQISIFLVGLALLVAIFGLGMR